MIDLKLNGSGFIDFTWYTLVSRLFEPALIRNSRLSWVFFNIFGQICLSYWTFGYSFSYLKFLSKQPFNFGYSRLVQFCREWTIWLTKFSCATAAITNCAWACASVCASSDMIEKLFANKKARTITKNNKNVYRFKILPD